MHWLHSGSAGISLYCWSPQFQGSTGQAVRLVCVAFCSDEKLCTVKWPFKSYSEACKMSRSFCTWMRNYGKFCWLFPVGYTYTFQCWNILYEGFVESLQTLHLHGFAVLALNNWSSCLILDKNIVVVTVNWNINFRPLFIYTNLRSRRTELYSWFVCKCLQKLFYTRPMNVGSCNVLWLGN